MRKIRPSLLLLPLVCTWLILPGSALAVGLYFKATGSVQGLIEGEVTVQGHEDWIEVLAFSHSVQTPIGINGQASGPPVTSPLHVTTYFDRSMTKLATAHATDEVFTSWEFEVVPDGGSTAAIRVEMEDARVTDMSWGGSGGETNLTALFGFAYSRITITDMVNGTSVTYDWYSPPASISPTLEKGITLSTSPNPTYGQTEFRFSLPADSDARLTLFDLRGHRVRDLHSGWTSTEPTVAVWDGTDDSGKKVAQGMYVARLTYPGREVTQRITVIR